ncbi:MAG: recombination protein NinB [Ramlibacter sp.]|nr:recombination protein NinB [Ramlibacter sp.]
MKRTYILGPLSRPTVLRAVQDAPEGHMVRIEEPKKRRIQEEKYHAMIGDIARQSPYAGRKWDADDMKRILVDEFAEEMRLAGTPLHHDGRLIPSENGRRVIQLGIQTSEFYVKEAAQFIEFLHAWGADRSVVWSEPKERQAA